MNAMKKNGRLFKRIAAAWVVAVSIAMRCAVAMADDTTPPKAAQPAPHEAATPAAPASPAIAEPALKPFGYTPGARQLQQSGDFVPVPDRWRIGFPSDYRQNVKSPNALNPYEQNFLKGDFAIPGTQDLFLSLNATSDTLFEARRLPVASGASTVRPGSFDFFGQGRQILINENLILSAELFTGDAAFEPRRWVFRVTPVLNFNYVHASENATIDPDVRRGQDRSDGWLGFQELFVEKRLDGLFPPSPKFDFSSIRLGIQGFTSDFRGFLFSDNEPGIRLFGNFDNNRLQYNLAWFTQLEKDTNSGLNTFDIRHQNVFLANVYRQDFLFPGYTGQLSFHANIDDSGPRTDKDGVIVRPAPVGTIHNKSVEAYYLGWAGDGHIGRLNLTHQFYQVFGHESFNPIAGQRVDINAQFAAVELSYDQDYLRYRASFAWASGDRNPTDGTAHGFDSIFDNPNFAGGGFNFFTRQAIHLADSGVNLVNRNSFLPNLRTGKEQGQSSFVNPGLLLYNVGVDADLTPKLKLITNVSYLQFDTTQPLQLLLHDNKIGKDIGLDVSVGVQYRPFLNNNAIINFGAAGLIPGRGFRDINTSQTLYSIFTGITLSY
jgi:hypothetical protein